MKQMWVKHPFYCYSKLFFSPLTCIFTDQIVRICRKPNLKQSTKQINRTKRNKKRFRIVLLPYCSKYGQTGTSSRTQLQRKSGIQKIMVPSFLQVPRNQDPCSMDMATPCEQIWQVHGMTIGHGYINWYKEFIITICIKLCLGNQTDKKRLASKNKRRLYQVKTVYLFLWIFKNNTYSLVHKITRVAILAIEHDAY